jgi:sensor histidine kinase regulating citrate/malate metabolism
MNQPWNSHNMTGDLLLQVLPVCLGRPGIAPSPGAGLIGPGPRESKGAGLDLAITKELVELHGGHIWMESNPCHGSVFWVQLPKNRASQPCS